MSTETTEEQTTYTFEQLTGLAQDKARDWLIEAATDYDWWQDIYSNAKIEGEAKGFEIEDIRFSGFWSQGSGASWTGNVRLDVWLEWMLDQPEDTAEHRWIDSNRTAYMILCTLIGEGLLNSTKVEVTRINYYYVHENTTAPESIDYEPLLDLQEAADTSEAHETTVANKDSILYGASAKRLIEHLDLKGLFNGLDEKLKDDVRDFNRHIYKQLEAEYDHLTDDEQLAEMAEANEWVFDENGKWL